MAKVQNLKVLNSADKTRHYTVCIGAGAPTDADDPIIADTLTYPVGSQYIDTEAQKFMVRYADNKVAADWK